MAYSETIISIVDGEKKANIWSNSSSWMNKIKKIKGYRESGDGLEVDVPKEFIKLDTKQ